MYDFLLVINTNLPPILHRFRDIAFDKSKWLYLATPLAFTPPIEKFPHIISSQVIYTLNHKKRDISFLTITLANLNRFL